MDVRAQYKDALGGLTIQLGLLNQLSCKYWSVEASEVCTAYAHSLPSVTTVMSASVHHSQVWRVKKACHDQSTRHMYMSSHNSRYAMSCQCHAVLLQVPSEAVCMHANAMQCYMVSLMDDEVCGTVHYWQ